MEMLVVFRTSSKDLKNLWYTTSIASIFLESTQISQAQLAMECTNMLKKSRRILTSIIHSFAHWKFNANNKHLLAIARHSTALSRFEVVSNKIPKYLKVYTCSIVSPSNINSWHGSTKLNTMTFFFFTFTLSPRSAQNCWNVFNCYYSPTFDYDIRSRSFTKSNNHTCKSVRTGASRSLLSKHLFRASKYSPNSKGLRRQPCFTPYWHLKLKVTPSLGWLMHTVSLVVCKH